MGLEKQNAIYPIRKSKVVTYSIGKGSVYEYKDNLFSDERLPKFVLITFMETSQINGDYSKYCSAFAHKNVKSITLTRNMNYRETYTMDFEKNDYTEAYVQSIIRNLGFLNTNHNNGITLKDFHERYPFFTFVLSPDFFIGQTQLPKTGNLKLDIRFSKALDVPITLIAYGLFDSEIQISKIGSIFT